MRYLVLGCSGMVGHTVALYLLQSGHHVLGVDNRPCTALPMQKMDLLAGNLLQGLITAGQYDAIINCAGLLNEAAEANASAAYRLNAELPHSIAAYIEDTQTQLVQISTDCVFSGVQGGYRAADTPDGVSIYARTKAAGEIHSSRHLTIRTSIIGPDMHADGIGLVNWFMGRTTCHGYANVCWTGITSLALARAVEAMVQNKAHGLIHLVPGNAISKHYLLCLMNHTLRADAVDIRAVCTPVSDMSLIPSPGIPPLPDYSRMLVETALWMQANRALYPHYPPKEHSQCKD